MPASTTKGAASVSLPNDLISDILSRTPVKSVCRFRCMSKEWRTLISDPAFVAAHKSRAEPLLVASSHEEPSKDSNLLMMDIDGNIVKKIKGLGGSWTSCTSLDDLLYVYHAVYGSLVIDPATGEVLVTCRKLGERDVHQNFGYGRAVPSGASRVVRLIDRIVNGGTQQTCEVLKLEKGAEWRQTQSPPIHVFYYRRPPVTVNGVLHFLATPQLDGDSVLCFDLESEEWKKVIEGPRKVTHESWEKTTMVSLAELNGALCMVQPEDYRTDHPCTNIWLLTDSDEGYTIPVSPTTFAVMPLWVMRDGGKLLIYCFIACKLAPVLQVYDPHTGTCTGAMETLVDFNGRIGLCSLHLERFVSAKT